MGKAAFSQHQNKQEERYLMNAKAICRLVPAILAVCILLLVQSVSAEEPKHSVTLPKTANGYEAYRDLMSDESITDVFVEEANEEFCSIDGVLFTKDGKEMLLYPKGRTEEEYAIPEGVEEAWGAFYYPENLKVLKLPASFCAFLDNEDEETLDYSEINDGLFDWCDSLERIEVDPDNPVFCSVDGVLFSKDRKTLIACPGCKQGEYEIPDGTEEIGARAFYMNEKLTGVYVPDSVQVIDDEAFLETVQIRRIRLPEKMQYIGYEAFRDCESLAELELPEGLTEITPGMLLGDTQLQGTLCIPESVTKIGQEALCFLFKVSDIYWPDHDIRCTLLDEDGEVDLEDKSDVFGWNDWGIADFTVVMHAHEGTPAVEWIKKYPHVISPQGVETMDAEGYAEVCARVMRESGYPEAEICYNPDLKWMAVKPLVAYNLHRAVAVFRQNGKTLLCGFDDLDGKWQLQWVNEQFLDVASLPVQLSYFGEDYLRLILPDPSNPDMENAVDYWFDARTLALKDAIYVTGYLWAENENVWRCRVEGEKLVYSYAEHWEKDEAGRWVEVEEEEFSTVQVNKEDLVLSTAKRLPVFPEGYVRKADDQ